MWTIYTASGDLSLLNAILNEVAMIANNTSLVWGFALMASMLHAVRANTGAMIEAHRQGSGPLLARGAFHMAAPVILAMMFTSPDAKVDVTVENTTTGASTVVANVPIIIAAIPVAGSTLAAAIGPPITTAMSGVNPVYGDITVAGHGFLDPMRRLLAARGASEHLGAVDTELRLVVGRCVSLDAGSDFASLNNLVMNAGNTGATAAQSIPIAGANPTGVGALLFQAAQNTTGLVPELQIGNSTILNCTDAAAQVASDLTAALTGPEFARVIQGAVNGMDQPLAGADYSADRFFTVNHSLRNWTSMSGALAVGQAQANAELVNFLFDEEVTSGLNCAQASTTDKSVCEATMMQATELDRNNLQAAANEVPMLEYAGSFANYILALVIGLGPVIVMFMMMFGVDAGRCIKTSMHILVWPLLVMNVGAELVNAMLSMQFANFEMSISQGGYLSPALVHNAYKELSLQVGVGSHIMASLPVLMSMIFALGEAAGLANVASEVTPKGDETGKAEAPSAIAPAPLMRANSPDTLKQGENGYYDVVAEGSLAAASGSQSYKSLSRSGTQSVSDAESREKRESSDRTSVQRFAKSLSDRDYGSLGLNWSQGESLRNELGNNLRESGTDGAQLSTRSERNNQLSAQVGGSIGASTNGSGSFGGTVPGRTSGSAMASKVAGASQFGASLTAKATGSASDQQSLGESVTRSSDLNLAKSVAKTLSSDVGKQVMDSAGKDSSKVLSAEKSAAESYVQSTTHRDSHTSTTAQALQETDGFVAATQSIGASEIAQHAVKNDEYRQFARMQGQAFESLEGSKKHMARAAGDMSSHSTDEIGGSDQAKTAVLRHMAAVSLARDTSLPEASRLSAVKYLLGESNAMTHGAFAAPSESDLKAPSRRIPLPGNSTGFSGSALRNEASHATKSAEGLARPEAQIDPRAKAGLASLHGAARAAADGGLHGLKTPDGRGISDAVDHTLESASKTGLGAGGDARKVLTRAAETITPAFNPGMTGEPVSVAAQQKGQPIIEGQP